MSRRNLLPLFVILASAPCALSARELPAAKPESVGMSTERMARIDSLVQRYVTGGQIGGAGTLVIRDGKGVQQVTYGDPEPNAQTQMRTDAM